MNKIAVLVKIFGGEINPFDASALETALRIGGEITVLSMSPPSCKDVLEGLTRLDADVVMISDCAYAGSDTLVTAKILARAIKKLSPDYVFCGRQSVNGDTGQVPPMIAELTGYSFRQKVVDFTGENFVFRNGEVGKIEKNSVVTFEKYVGLRFPSIFSRKKEVAVWNNDVLGFDETQCGTAGSPTKVVKSYENAVGRRSCRFVPYDKLGEVIEEALSENTDERKERFAGQKIPYVGYVGEAREFAVARAERANEITEVGAEKIAENVLKENYDAVIFPESDKWKAVASSVAVILNYGLCASCTDLRYDGEKAVMTRPAFGGSVTADIVSASKTALCSVNVASHGTNRIAFCVGMGAVHKIEEIKRLAEKYGGELCATRAVVDKGIMPYSAQVGLTGKTVSPKVYVAIGVSGAVQHTCAIERAGKVIAVNVDKNARIFDYADYGITEEI